MTSWITYARPFAKRRAKYLRSRRLHRARGYYDRAEHYTTAIHVIDATWQDFKAAMEGKA